MFFAGVLLFTIPDVKAQSAVHGKSVVIIDEDIPYLETLLPGIKPGTIKVYLDKSLPPLSAIHKVIRENAPLSSLHLLTHGKSGALTFSYDELNLGTIEKNEDLLGSWKQYFIHHGDIILYGSEIGKGSAGLSFVTNLAVTTGLDVAASKDLTGATLKHGDWLLELRSGYIESTLVISKQIRNQYQAILSDDSTKRSISALIR